MPSRNTYRLTWVSLTLDTSKVRETQVRHVSLHGCSSKAQLQLFTLEEVAPPDLESGVAPLGPHSRCYLLDVGLLLSAAAPDLGRWVAPLGRCP